MDKDTTKTTEAARHTPGPWSMDKTQWDSSPYSILDSHGEQVGATIYGQSGGVEEAKANARLIAAAPDMLEVCEELLKAYNIDICDAIAYKPAVEMARAAIAKARGQ